MTNNSPYVRKPASVTRVMGTVLLALLPGIAAYVWQFGPAILGQLAIATATALACEALMLAVRGKPLRLFPPSVPFFTQLCNLLPQQPVFSL